MLRDRIRELAICLLGAATVTLFCAGPVIAWFLIAGLRKLVVAYPP